MSEEKEIKVKTLDQTDYREIADEVIAVLMKREVLVSDVPAILKLVKDKSEMSFISPVANPWIG